MIVILGILSAVVVFAVRGAGDKGRGAAVAADERIIRTAEELHCAQHSSYADEATLVNKKFLSAAPEIHKVQVGDVEAHFTNPEVPMQGNCPDSPKHYKILCRDDSPMPNCGSAPPPEPVVDCAAPPAQWAPLSWCPAAPGAKLVGSLRIEGHYKTIAPLVELTDGKVLTLTGTKDPAYAPPPEYPIEKTEIYDPANDTWTQEAPPPDRLLEAYERLLITDADPGLGSTCAINCNKVLLNGLIADATVPAGGPVQHAHEGFYLYDPTSGVAKWSLVAQAAPEKKSGAQMSQINGPNCGTNCGKIVIVKRQAPIRTSIGALVYGSPVR